MNKYRYILYIICALCTLSCVDDKMPNGGTFLDRPYHLSIGKDVLSFGASQNLSDYIVINSNDVSWEITGAPDWLTLSATDGSGNAVVTVTASENKSIDNPRAARLNITSTSPKYQYNKSIAVSQAAMAVGITVDKTSLSLAPQAVTESVAVNSNVEWEATCSSSWITLSKTGDTALQISASENRTGTARTATVNLCRKGFTATLATISVTQSEGGVTGSTEEVAFGLDGGTKSVEIDADVAWNASSSASWLAVTPEEGAAGKAQLKITALANSSANSRNGFVYIKIGDVKKLSISVSQEGISLEVNGTLQNFAASGSDSQKLSVTANKEWKVLSSPEWVTVTPGEGSKGTTEVTVKAAENRSLNPRSATFRIGFEGLNVYKDITVAQEGLDSEFGGSTLEFPWEASQKDIEIVLIQDRPFAVYGRAFQSVRDKGIAVNRKTDVVKVQPREAGLGENVQVFGLVAPVVYAAPYVGVVISRSDYNGKSRFFDGVKALAHSRGGHEATVEKVARNDHGITALVLGLFQGLGEAQSVLLSQPVALAQAEAREGAVQVEITRMEEFYCFLYHYRVTSVLVLIVFFLLYHFVLRASIAAGHVGVKLIFTRRIYPS